MDEIKEAAQKLKNGFLVAFPTETVYGLGADATNQESVARIFEIKNRPQDHPLIVHLSSLDQLPDWSIEIPKFTNELANSFWPGPMTLILKRNIIAKDFVTGGQETIGIRIPNHEIALSLLEEFRKIGSGAIAAPSANKFGKVSPTSFEHVKSEIGKDLSQEDLILDGGISFVGIESTIIDCTGSSPKVLRPGAITDKMIEDVTGMQLSKQVSDIRVSGSFSSHYAPSAKVVLDVEPQEGDGFIALAKFETPLGVTRLISPNSVEEFAQELYSAFHIADQMNLRRVVVISPDGDDLALAIRDRLLKASKGK
ncbi:MAG: L-threonylcarbamoyladenylate synthase [Candidatus Nanopelagicales bacterium]